MSARSLLFASPNEWSLGHVLCCSSDAIEHSCCLIYMFVHCTVCNLQLDIVAIIECFGSDITASRVPIIMIILSTAQPLLLTCTWTE